EQCGSDAGQPDLVENGLSGRSVFVGVTSEDRNEFGERDGLGPERRGVEGKQENGDRHSRDQRDDDAARPVNRRVSRVQGHKHP
ncbi:hypothetical protein DF186_20850, partial [Enterococcus hirae]